MQPRRRVFDLLDNRPGDPRSRFIAVGLQVLIGANVAAVILETVQPVHAAYRTAFTAFHILSMLIFTVEYVLRLWCAPEFRRADGSPRFSDDIGGRLRYAATPLALIDLATLASFYAGALVGVDLRWLRVMRLVGLLKFTRYSQALMTAGDVVRAEAGGLAAAGAVFAVAAILAAAGMYAFEHEAQPDKFTSIPAALYWAVVTLTTLGYGDVVPITTGGRIFAGLVATTGIGMVAFPSAILASGFVRQLRLHSHEIRGAGVAAEVKRLGLTDEDAARLVGVVLRDDALQVCPNCNEPLDHHGRHVSSRFAP